MTELEILYLKHLSRQSEIAMVGEPIFKNLYRMGFAEMQPLPTLPIMDNNGRLINTQLCLWKLTHWGKVELEELMLREAMQ